MTAIEFAVGLTGGIGSGKSTIADQFAARGAAVIDTDYIAHQLTTSGGAAMAAIAEQFGSDFLTPEGALDRVKMRNHVFSRPQERKSLEAILHPLITTEAEHAALLASGPYVIFAVPLLIESDFWRKRVSRVLVVDCPEQLQVTRVMQRSGLSEAQVRAIMATQVSRKTRLEAADDVLVNDADIAKLAPQIDRLHALYLSLAQPNQINKKRDL